MRYDATTTILGPSRGSASAFLDWAMARGAARPDDVRLYLDTIYELAPRVGLRAEALVAQAVLASSEDGVPWTSYWWMERCNCIGIGITGDPEGNQSSRDFGNGRNIALCHLVHTWLLAVGPDLPPELAPHRDQHPRWDAAVAAGMAGTVTRLGDSTSRWATADPRAGSLPAQLTMLEAQGVLGGLETANGHGDVQAANGHGEMAAPEAPSGSTDSSGAAPPDTGIGGLTPRMRADIVEGARAAMEPEPGPDSREGWAMAMPPDLEAAPVPPLESTPGGEAGQTPQAAPSAYARLDCPASVQRGDEFEITVGLAPEPAAGSDEVEAIDLPPATPEPYDIILQLSLKNLLPADGQALRHTLTIGPDSPYPTVSVRLRVRPDETELVGVVHASYVLGSEIIGGAMRVLGIAAIAATRIAAPPPRPLAAPTALVAPDLTIQIREGDKEGDLVWSYFPKDTAIDLTGIGTESEIGDEPQAFLRTVMRTLEHAEEAELPLLMPGIGREIAERLPRGFFSLLERVSTRPDQPPSVLLVSEDGFVPWELAYVESPKYPGAPYFGAQATIGRWYPTGNDPLAEGVPTLPASPPGTVTVDTMAVLWGEYADLPLPAAKEEAERLIAAYGAEAVPTTFASVLAYLKRPPAHGLIHYSGHGLYGADAGSGGLKLIDGKEIGALLVRGATFPGHPLVFLNACQVGAGFALLGGVGGLIDSFIGSGASAVIAPLWAVNDPIANELAAEFYAKAVPTDADATPVYPAAVLQEQRARFDGTGSPSVMAYQFFGHPNLVMARTP
jgi:hypothetical protein